MSTTDAFGSSGGWGGDDLDLTGNTVSEGLPILKTGIYDAVAKEAEVKKTKSGKALAVTFHDLKGTGQITFHFNYVNSSAEAQRIARDQLKTFLTHAGHPDPDHPFKYPKERMLDIPVRIYVEHDGTYVKNNRTLDSYAVKRFAKVDPENPAPGRAPEAPSLGGGRSSGGSSGGAASNYHRPLDDEIPF